MPLPFFGPISLDNIQAEFGGSNPIAINEYYRGGAYTPSGRLRVPTGSFDIQFVAADEVAISYVRAFQASCDWLG